MNIVQKVMESDKKKNRTFIFKYKPAKYLKANCINFCQVLIHIHRPNMYESHELHNIT